MQSKKTVVEFAKREYKALIELKKLGAPSVEPIAVIEGRTNSCRGRIALRNSY